MIYKTEAGRRDIQARYTEYLDRWPVPAERHTAATREGDTFVLASGPPDAPPLVLLHGSGSNAAMWAGDVAAWSEHFRVLAVDVVGEPGRSAQSRPPLDTLAPWLDDVIDHFGLDAAAFVGASLGGWLATDYASTRPHRVSALGLLCPGGIGRQKVGFLVKALLYKPFGSWGAHRSIKAATGVDTPEVADYLVAIFRQFRPRYDRLPIFSDAALAALTMPVLAIVGARDAMLDSRGTAERLRRAVPHATVTVLPEVGHAVLGQTGPVLDFLRSAAAAR
ncbi:alpha/beta fold hydrolase [Actinokineospora guangxiensis]|uniref:Alpha/beta fold hydrolase n=1 Tax=Actinokineospora guangxiensis TaxID=1490288 RepID=A0ABW0ERD4_9PSEU